MEDVEAHYRVAYFYAFLDHTLNHLKTRFSKELEGALLAAYLIAGNLKNLRDEIVAKLLELSPVLFLVTRTSVNIIKCLPKASTECAVRKFPAILEAVVCKNDHTSWNWLVCFSRHCLRHPSRENLYRSLATAINNQLREEADPPPALIQLEEGYFRGAVRSSCSVDNQTQAPPE